MKEHLTMNYDDNQKTKTEMNRFDYAVMKTLYAFRRRFLEV